MYKTILTIVCLILCGSLSATEQDFGDQQKERVSVVNVEVPVRVYHKGTPVINLTRHDFKLYEGGKLQTLNGFIKKKKKIQLQNLVMEVNQTVNQKSRYFVLVFRLTQYNEHVRKGIDYIFKRVLNEVDELLVFVNNKSKYYPNLKEKRSVKDELDQFLKSESREARNKQLAHVHSIETLINKQKFERGLQNPVSYHWIIEEFFRKFLDVWKDYKKRYLIPDINKYYNFSNMLKKIDKEKWVLSFYQMDIFPDILLNSENMEHIKRKLGEWEIGDRAEVISAVRIIRRHINDIKKEMSFAKDFPADEVAKLFHNVDATFHSIFMKTFATTLQQDMRYKEVASELENSLRSITKLTGGELIVSNKIDQSLEELSEVEDNYYVLTYEPKNPKKVGKIKVKLKNRKYKAVYSPNLRFGFLRDFLEGKKFEPKTVIIKDLAFKKGKLKLSLTDFYMDKKNIGALSIRIRIKDNAGHSYFDQKKSIKATQNKINISLTFGTLKKGDYDLIIDVTDLYSNMSKTETLKIKI